MLYNRKPEGILSGMTRLNDNVGEQDIHLTVANILNISQCPQRELN